MQLISSLLLATAAERTALLVIDVQNDFMPSGSLPAAGGDEVVSRTNALREAMDFDLTVFTQSLTGIQIITFLLPPLTTARMLMI